MDASAMATGLPPGTRRTSALAGAALQADHRGEEEQIGQEERDDRHADQHVIRAADRGSRLAEKGHDDAGTP